jgi:GAF domain-containing protein
VAREAAAIQDLERLLAETAELVSRRFGFYHTGIFMLDPTRQYAVLRAASSAGGQKMMARGHRLRVGQEGIVGQVTAMGEPHIALDVGSDAVFFDNPDLPQTRSEIALPLRARGEIIGALDVQSQEPAAFGPDDISVLQILSDQVAVAISNARLFEQLQHSLEAERLAYGSLSRKAWQSLIQQQGRLERRYDPQGILAESDDWREEMKQALTTAEPAPGRDATWPSVAVPVKVRGQVIGVLDAFKPASDEGDQDVWLEDEVTLLEALADQLGAALDGARLYEETQRRASQERLAAEVTARMRETLDVDTVLRTAAQEIRQAMGLSAMTIRLITGDGSRHSSVDDKPAGNGGDRPLSNDAEPDQG